ncbi:MAG: trigger factor [Candidatus Cloacimonetes bacterium]|nr:trigger factor [Candidatus Cloacimonadota bacterium]
MKSEIKEISQCEREIIITVDAEQASKDYYQILNKVKNHISLPGFRKGKAPLNLLEKNFGDYLKEEFFNKQIGNYYKTALEQSDLNPVSQGEATSIEWEKGKDLVACFRCEVMPEIKLHGYKELEIPFEPVEFKPEMIEATLEDFRKNMATETTADTPAREGDLLILEISLPGDDDKPARKIRREILLGENQYAAELNRKLTGASPDDQIISILFDSSASPPDREVDANFIDREFEITVKEVKRFILPELNDEFAADLEYESLSDLRSSVETELKAKIAKDNRSTLKENILQKLVEVNPFELPRSMVNRYAEDMALSYAKAYKTDVQKVMPLYQQIASFNLKSHYLLEEIKKLEKIEVTAEDREILISEAAENLKMDIEEYRKLYSKEIESADFNYTAEERKILKMIEESSKFVPYPRETDDKKKKKSK